MNKNTWGYRYAHEEGAREGDNCACGQHPKIRRLVEGLHDAMEDHRNYNTEMTRKNVKNHLDSLTHMHQYAINLHDPNTDSNAIQIHKNNINALRQQHKGL